MSVPIPTITIRPVGPYLVRGEVALQDLEGNPIPIPPSKTPGVFKLCSCGQSNSKPFCDGSHHPKPPAGG